MSLDKILDEIDKNTENVTLEMFIGVLTEMYPPEIKRHLTKIRNMITVNSKLIKALRVAIEELQVIESEDSDFSQKVIAGSAIKELEQILKEET